MHMDLVQKVKQSDCSLVAYRRNKELSNDMSATLYIYIKSY
jgi:hypothetical protein